MTDAEFWGVLAEMIDGAGCLPDFDHTTGCSGLCECLETALWYQLIDRPQYERLDRQLDDTYFRGYRAHYSYNYYWPDGAIAPRIRACRRLMRDCLKRDGC